jgi:hypothetical protein
VALGTDKSHAPTAPRESVFNDVGRQSIPSENMIGKGRNDPSLLTGGIDHREVLLRKMRERVRCFS